LLSEQSDESEKSISYSKFPKVERKVFSHNYLDQVIIELRFPTLLSLKEREPKDIQNSIREQFPLYSPTQRMQVTPLGSTEPEPIYQFADRKGDPYIELSSSNIVLIAKHYQSFQVFEEKIEFLIERCLPFIKTDFFTRIGLRYVNNIAGIPNSLEGFNQWINPKLLSSIGGEEMGSVGDMKCEITGLLEKGGTYKFKYGLSPAQPNRSFVLDYDYGKLDVDVDSSLETLNSFHDVHFDFFWWSLGDAAREALESGSIKKS
jgi:uncharacterized protein (TIGR04255 family)